MPEIPTFVSTQGYGSGVAQDGQISPAVAGAMMGTMVEGFDRVSSTFADINPHTARRVSDSMRIGPEGPTRRGVVGDDRDQAIGVGI